MAQIAAWERSNEFKPDDFKNVEKGMENESHTEAWPWSKAQPSFPTDHLGFQWFLPSLYSEVVLRTDSSTEIQSRAWIWSEGGGWMLWFCECFWLLSLSPVSQHRCVWLLSSFLQSSLASQCSCLSICSGASPWSVLCPAWAHWVFVGHVALRLENCVIWHNSGKSHVTCKSFSVFL
jgi:hypothetical protein